jgi:acetyltransferase-like isoleucine patch superfamily enzyme
MLEIVLTREDANTEFALLAEWLVADRSEVEQGQAVVVVETTKATVEVEAPGAGTIVQLYAEGVEVELGKTIARIAESADELAALDQEPATEAAPTPSPGEQKATKKAIAVAERHGVDLSEIDKRGFITERDVEELVARRKAAAAPGVGPQLAGVSTDGVSLPDSFELDERVGALDPGFLTHLRSEPESFRRLSSAEKLDAYRQSGAVVGDGVELGEGSLIVAPRVVLADGVSLGAGAEVVCEEVVAFGALTTFGPNLELRCRRAYLGAGIWGGRDVRFGGGGHRDPWAVLTVGDLAFVGDEAFVNVCRPVLIGREVFLTMRSLIVTHNIGHSVLEGFENKFAPVVLEDRSQIGLGAVIYAGCRIGAEAIVASGSYVTGDLHELLALRGHQVSTVEDDAAFVVEGVRVSFTPTYAGGGSSPEVVLTLELESEDVPEGSAVLDLLGRRVHGSGGAVLDSVREFCRKRGIRLEPGPWRYSGGLL